MRPRRAAIPSAAERPPMLPSRDAARLVPSPVALMPALRAS